MAFHVIHPGWRVTELRRKAIAMRSSGQKMDLEPGGHLLSLVAFSWLAEVCAEGKAGATHKEAVSRARKSGHEAQRRRTLLRAC